MHFSQSVKRGVVLVALGLLAMVLLGACTMLGGEEAGVTIPEIVVEATDAGLSVPADTPSGIVAFKMGDLESALPARLNEGVTLDQLNEALAQPDPFAALGLLTLLGGANHTTDGRVIVDLKPGQHVILNFPENAAPAVYPFTAGDPSGATAPAADVTVDLVDFNFGLQPEVAAGPQVWQINNKGQQWHEMAIVKLNEGATVDDVLAMLQSGEESADPPPFEQVAFWSPNSPGETGYVTWDLPAGEYTVICFLPDIAGDMTAHAAHGMVSTLTVTE